MVHESISNVVSLLDHRATLSPGATRTVCQLGKEQVVVSFGSRRADVPSEDSDYADFAGLIATLVARL